MSEKRCSITSAAGMLGRSYSSTHNLAVSGRLGPVTEEGGRLYLDPEAVQAFARSPTVRKGGEALTLPDYRA